MTGVLCWGMTGRWEHFGETGRCCCRLQPRGGKVSDAEARSGQRRTCWEVGVRLRDEQAREAALRELEEETGFLGEVVRSAEPVEVDTEDGDFLIHPFLVVVKGTRPQLSREHTRWKWVFAEDVTEMDTVPELEKDLRALGIETSTGYSPN